MKVSFVGGARHVEVDEVGDEFEEDEHRARPHGFEVRDQSCGGGLPDVTNSHICRQALSN